MPLLQAGPLRVRSLGPTSDEASVSRDGPSIVLCHGFGAPGDDLVPLARATDAGPTTRWFFPEAPLAVDELGDIAPATPDWDEGRAWWPVDMLRLQMELARGARAWDPTATPEGMPEARGALIAALKALVADGAIAPSRTVLGGFSQGAMLATAVALAAAETGMRFAGLAILSGAEIDRARWDAALEHEGRSLHVLQSHGRRDPLLPFTVAESLHRRLVAAGADATFLPFDGGHEIPSAVLLALGPFARATLIRG